MAKAKQGKGSLVGPAIALLFKALAVAVAILTPLLGVWGASSLAAYLNGPVWAVLLSGLLLFPLLPVGWDLFASWRRGRGERRERSKREDKSLPFEAKPRFLTWIDRLILRTLALNLLFIVGLLASYPEKGFEALSTRGDWMLEGRDDSTSNAVRDGLFWTASKLEWVYLASRDNPFSDEQQGVDDGDEDVPAPKPAPTPTAKPGERTASGAPAPTTTGSGAPDEPALPDPPDGDGDSDGQGDEPDGEPKARAKRWPLPVELHPAVVDLPENREETIESVANYIKEQEPDPFWRVKALHDYVADRVAYDAPAYAAGRYPPQDAGTVFDKKVGVCAGYARLMAALGKVTGDRIVYVGGNARTEGWDLSGGGHAWNAAEIEGSWYLLDATWDAGSVNGTKFTKGYRTDYLFTPVKVFGLDHLPDKPKWQLRDKPLSRGEFLRQPMMSPGFYAAGFELLKPKRSQVTVEGSIGIEIENPRGMFMTSTFTNDGGGDAGRCQVDSGPRINVACKFPGDGRYTVNLFANDEQYGSYSYVGRVGVNSD